MKQTAPTPPFDLSGLETCHAQLHLFLKSTLIAPGSIGPERRLKIIDLMEEIDELLINLRIDALYPKDITNQKDEG